MSHLGNFDQIWRALVTYKGTISVFLPNRWQIWLFTTLSFQVKFFNFLKSKPDTFPGNTGNKEASKPIKKERKEKELKWRKK